jgi:hypothetical protein
MTTRRSRSCAAMLLVALGGAVLLSGCSGPTPLCDQASVLVGQGQLAQGTALYARAKEQGEGACAGKGLTAAADQYGRAATEEARGAAAEQVGDVAGAVTAYRSALAQDAGNPLAAAGLARFGQAAVRPPEIPTGPPLPAPTPRTPWWATPWPYVIGSTLLAILFFGMSIAYTRRSSERIREQLDEQCKALERELRSERERYDRLFDRLAGLVADLKSDVTGERERYFKQIVPQKKPDSAGANNICLTDARIFAVATPDGRDHLIVQRIRWSTDREHAKATLSGTVTAGEFDPVMLAHALADGAVYPAWEGVRATWVMEDYCGSTSGARATEELQEQYYDLVRGLPVRAAEPRRGLVSKELTEVAAGSVCPNHNGFANIKRLVRFAGIVDGPSVTHACLTTLVGDLPSELAALRLEDAAGTTTSPVRTTTVESAAGSAPAQVAELGLSLEAARNPQQTAAAAASTETRETALDEDRAPVTVYVIAEPHDPLSVRQGRSSASGATFIRNGRVVIGDGSEVRLSSEYRIARVEVDAERMMESLSPRAQKALRKLIKDPSDAVANEEFRRALRPPEGPAVPSARDLRHQSVVSTPVEITTIDCDVVAIGDNQRHNVTIEHRVARASLDIAGIMKDSAELASAFAHQLSPTERNHRRGEFDRALTEAVTPEHLRSVVSTVPGRSPQIVAGRGSVTAVEAPVSIVGKKPKFTRKNPDVTARSIKIRHSRGITEHVFPDISGADERSRGQRSRDDISGPELSI